MSIEELDKQIDKALSRWETPSNQHKKAIWHSIEKSIGVKQPNKIIKWRWAAAASLAAIIISYAFLYNANVSYSTNLGESIAIDLPDGSFVNINEESTVSYNSIAWYVSRSLTMSGEAFFKVKKGSKFLVKTNNGTVKVLGTSFNVLTRENLFSVACYTGTVEVDNNINNVIITQGENVSQSNDLALSKGVIASKLNSPLWMIDNHSYTKVKLTNVLDDIANQYSITITANDKINKMKFTGEWNSEMALEDVLKIVCLPFNLEAKLLDNNEYKVQEIEQ